MQFTGFGNSIPDGEQFAQETRVPVLTLEGKCLRRRAKPAHLVRHLPIAHMEHMDKLYSLERDGTIPGDGADFLTCSLRFGNPVLLDRRVT
jgi:hypothetical protein